MPVAEFFLPRSLPEAVDLLRVHGPDLVVMGGGTLVMAAINDGHLFPKRAMSLRRAGLDGVNTANGQVEVGAGVTASRLARIEALPPLARAAALLGGPALRTMATVGGNLFARPPYGDLAVPLLALDATVELAGPDGTRSLPLTDFYAERGAPDGPRPGELVAGLRVPCPNDATAYVKLGRRQANTPSVAAVAACLAMDADGRCQDVRIALGAAGPTPLRARTAEAALAGQRLDADAVEEAALAAMAECDPPTDALATAWYRRQMVGVAVRRALAQVINGATLAAGAAS